MDIDFGKEFKRMAEQFEISDKEVLSSVRTMIRSMWGDSVFKQTFLKRNSELVINENPRSKKRYPKVLKYRCAICGELFGSAEIELDHLVSENSLTSYEHINDFLTNIVLTSPDKLQVLCKDKKTKKLGITRFGCHSIKTYSERYNVTFEESGAEKEAKRLVDKKLDKQFLIDHNVKAENIGSTQVVRRKQIVEILLELNKLKEKINE
jgi:ribosomal protein L36